MEGSAAKLIDETQEGMRAVVALATSRLREAEEALQAGDFVNAQRRADEAAARIAPLSYAETYLAAFANKMVVRGREIAEGMEIVGDGVVTSVENVSDHDDDCADAVFQYMLEGGVGKRARSDQEILVARSGD